MIVVVSDAADVHYRCVAEQLRRMGQKSALVELSKLGSEARFTMSTGAGRSQKWSGSGAWALELEDVRSVWYRRVFPPRLQPEPASEADTTWALREWREATTSAFVALNARFVSPPWAQELAGMKPYQLRVAEDVGLRVPDTIMTNDAAAARAFVEKYSGQVIHKVVKTPRDRFLGTKQWSKADEEELRWLYLTPTFFQERIVAPHELRVTVVGRQIFAAEFPVAKEVVDARSELDRPFSRAPLPREVEQKLRALMDRLDLQYGTIDLKRRADGEHVFLELNPQGQFLYVEIKTGMPITSAMAELLAAGS